MRASFPTACLTAAIVLAAALPLSRAASAADPYDENYTEPPYDETYEAYEKGESRYSAERHPRYGEARPSERYDAPYDNGELPGSIKDGYPVPMPPPEAGAPPPPPRYAERPPVRVERYERERYTAACLDRWEIRRELRREGWRDIRPLGGDGGIVHVRARRSGSGRPFDLRVDRCSGEVLAARPRHHGVAYRDHGEGYRDWRWVK